MGAITHSANKTIKIWKTEIVGDEELVDLGINSNDYKIGQVVYANTKKGLVVKALDGFVSILEIQPENSKRLTFAEFINGQHVTEGYFFE
jgi:methionyl-tRNA formyltransferase